VHEALGVQPSTSKMEVVCACLRVASAAPAASFKSRLPYMWFSLADENQVSECACQAVKVRGSHGFIKAIVFERFFSRDNLKYGRKSRKSSTRKFNNFNCDGIFSMAIWFTPWRTRRMEPTRGRLPKSSNIK
jgi:hypothetical protein